MLNRLLARCHGGALITVLIVIMLLACFAAALLELSMSRSTRTLRLERHVKALYLAESGVNVDLDDINHGGNGNKNATTPVTLGDGTYTATTTREPGLEAVRIRGEGRCFDDVRVVEILAVRQRNNLKAFQYAIFGVNGVHLDANAMVDSYDSAKGKWETQAVNRIRSIEYAGLEGNVGTNASQLTMDSNSGVLGNTAPGPNGNVQNSGNSFVTGARKPLAEPEYFPVVPVPDGYQSWRNPGSVPRDYVNNKVNEVLPSGTYYFTRFILNSNVKVSITGPATVVVDRFEMNANVNLNIDATNGPVNIYSTGRFVMSSNVVLSSTTQTPSNVTIYSTLDSSTMTDPEVVFSIRSNSDFYGSIYAPKTNVTIDSNFDIYGSLVGGMININSNSRIHYDTQLREKETVVWGPYVVKHWREIPGQP